jgi:hypothetical protein
LVAATKKKVVEIDGQWKVKTSSTLILTWPLSSSLSFNEKSELETLSKVCVNLKVKGMMLLSQDSDMVFV